MISTAHVGKVPSPAASSTICQDRKRTRYHQLNFDGAEEDQVNVYGVIVDAQYPSNVKDKWICALKVIDGSYHTLGNAKDDNFKVATIIIYARRFEDCPLVKQIGDVIRVHRANFKEHKGQRQFNANVHFNSSWCLFTTKPQHALKGDESNSDEEMRDENAEDEGKLGQGEYDPYKFSGKNYTLDLSVHKGILKSLRKWAIKYLSNNSVIHMSTYQQLNTLEGDEVKGRDIDLLVKVLKVFEKDEQTLELRIKDNSNQLWFLTLPKLRFGGNINLREGEIIRVRSVIKDQTSRGKRVNSKMSTNILKFLPCAKIVLEMTQKIHNITDEEKMLLEDESEVIMNAVTLTETPGFEQGNVNNNVKLQTLFLNYEAELKDAQKKKNRFSVRFSTYRVDPQDARDIVKSMCPECKETTSCKDLNAAGKAKCKECKTDCKLIYCMQLLVKDQPSQINKNFYRVLLYSYEENMGDKFFNMEPVNLWHKDNAQQLEKIQFYVQAMTRFNVWIDAILERRNQYFMIRDTQIKECF